MTMLTLGRLNAIWSTCVLFLFILHDNAQVTKSDLCDPHPLIKSESHSQPSGRLSCLLCCVSLHPTHLNHIFLFEVAFVLLDPPSWWINSRLSLSYSSLGVLAWMISFASLSMWLCVCVYTCRCYYYKLVCSFSVTFAKLYCFELIFKWVNLRVFDEFTLYCM